MKSRKKVISAFKRDFFHFDTSLVKGTTCGKDWGFFTVHVDEFTDRKNYDNGRRFFTILVEDVIRKITKIMTLK